MDIFPNKGGGGAIRPVYIDSMSTQIKEVCHPTIKKKQLTKGGGGSASRLGFIDSISTHIKEI